MKHYLDYSQIKKRDIGEFHGLGNETFVKFTNLFNLSCPIYVHMCGITYPTADYYIKRSPVTTNILEYVVSGEGHVTVGGVDHRVTAGQSYLLKVGEHAEYYADPQNPYKKLWVNFNGPLASELISHYKLRDTVYCNVDLTELFEKLFALETISYDVADVHFDMCSILTEMLMRLAKSVPSHHYASETAQKIRQLLISAIYEKFSLESICKELSLSKSEVIRYFKASYNVTPYQYLLNGKFNVAKSHLEYGTKTVAEIAECLGFNSPYHFSSLFKQHVGVSPMQYRAEKRQK